MLGLALGIDWSIRVTFVCVISAFCNDHIVFTVCAMQGSVCPYCLCKDQFVYIVCAVSVCRYCLCSISLSVLSVQVSVCLYCLCNYQFVRIVCSGVSVYNIVVLCMIGLPVALLLKENLDACYALISLFIFFATTTTICLVFIPKVSSCIMACRQIYQTVTSVNTLGRFYIS